MMFSVILLVVFLGGMVFHSTLAAESEGLVKCGNDSDPSNRCTLCHLVLGFKTIIDYGFVIFVTLALLMVVVGGVMYIISAGDQGLIGTAKGILKNALFGFCFVLLAWFLVNFTIYILKANVGVEGTGKLWYKFTCDSKPGVTEGEW